MSLLPLPSTFSDLLSLSSQANRSLVFDRGMDRYQDGRTFGIPAGGKEAFLQGFCGEYRQDRRGHFDHFVARRSKALEKAGAKVIDMTTHARLVIGLGLPHPIETGFLFDRLSGSVYLPGSSVKGVMRAAARLVAGGELEGDAGFWRESLDRLFGPPIEPGTVPRTGSLRFYDAFPVRWPRLEVDVLTPHFTRYYDGKTGAVPADWESPNPVPFLTVAEGQVFRFHVGSSDGERWEEDWKKVETLLGTALEWLGIGGKKSSGYGQLKACPLPDRPTPLPVEEEKPVRKNPVLDNVLLKLHQGKATAFRGDKPAATCRPEDLDPELLKALKKSTKGLRADVEVVKTGQDARIVGVPRWRTDP